MHKKSILENFRLGAKNVHTPPPSFTTNNLNTLSPFSTSQQSNMTRNMLQSSQFQISNPPSTTLRTYLYINATYTQPVTNPSLILSNFSNIPTYNTVPPSTIPQSTVSQPTYKNSSTSISQSIKPFDGLDHNYSPEEYLQHIEACMGNNPHLITNINFGTLGEWLSDNAL